MDALVAATIAFFEQSKYAFIFIGSYVEGSAVMMTTGLLWHLGIVSFWPAYIALTAGDILSDIMWYVIGRYGARTFLSRWGHLFHITPEIIEKMEVRFNRYHTKLLIASKLSMGLGFAVPILITAGVMRVPFWRFMAINILGGIVWILCLMGVGYYFGNVLAYIPKNAQVALIITVPIAFFFALREINRRFQTIKW